MKRFIIKIILFFLLITLGLSLILIKYGGFVDYFYQKFTVPKQTSMILGDSRSLQGIQPRIINQELKASGYDLPVFNYSFTIGQSNYGKPYTESIKKKLKSSKNGLFILSVHPWLFTEREGDDLKNNIYSERSLPPHNMHFVNVNPNFEYLVKNFNYLHFRTLFRQTAELHKDGWLEDRNSHKDAGTQNEWKNKKVLMYKGLSQNWRKSAVRINDFADLISFLQKNGRVVLVRMPVDSKILTIENRFWSNFDHEMVSVSRKMNVRYINFSESNKYQTYDGNHLDKKYSTIFTTDLCDSLRTQK